jgi:hypothetical protein
VKIWGFPLLDLAMIVLYFAGVLYIGPVVNECTAGPADLREREAEIARWDARHVRGVVVLAGLIMRQGAS